MAFGIHPLPSDQLALMKAQTVWRDTVPADRLALLHVSYIDFSGTQHEDGQMVVFDVVADAVLSVFEALYAQQFPIHSIKPMEHYGGDDEASMAANNSSALNDRVIMGSDVVSMHAYGMAVDINPLQNPYAVIGEQGKQVIYPPEGAAYMERSNQRAGMVEPIVSLWKKAGFTVWGGDWNTPLDYHHFQVERALAEQLVVVDYAEGVRLWNKES